MDTTITGIGAVVVAELRSAGYMESTIGQYEKSIKALSGYARRHGTSIYTPALGAGFASVDDQSAHGPVQRPAQVRLSAAGGGFRLVPGNRPGRPVDASTRWRRPKAGRGPVRGA